MKRKNKNFDNLIFMLHAMKNFSKQIYILIFIQVPVKVLMPFLAVWLSRTVVQVLETNGCSDVLIRHVLVLGGLLAAGSWLSQYVSGTLQTMMGAFKSELEDRFLMHKIICSYEELENRGQKAKLAEAQYYLWRSDGSISKSVEIAVDFFAGIFGFVLYTGLLLEFDKWVLLLMVLTALISFAFSDSGAKLREKMGWNIATKYITNLHQVCSQPKAGKDIRLFQMQHWFEEKFTVYLHSSRRNFHGKIARKELQSGIVVSLTSFIRDIVVYGYLIWMFYQKDLLLSDVVLLIGAASGFSTWVYQAVNQLSNLKQLSIEIGVIRSYIEMDVKPEQDAAVEKTDENCEIEFRNVSFHYPGGSKEIIKNLSFRIKRGEKIALVGVNGAGKTTCVKLLCGLLKPTSGEICMNGRNTADMTEEELYRCVSAVFQDSTLLPVSIRDNISSFGRYGDPEKVTECLEKAGILERIERLPQKEETRLLQELNENGVSFSGGELQRFMLARAICKEAPILILDEPTAALDPIAESQIYQKYVELVNRRTSVFISHRLASTQFCDRIFVLEHGEIVEEGTHQELLKKDGVYAKTFSLQSYYYNQAL